MIFTVSVSFLPTKWHSRLGWRRIVGNGLLPLFDPWLRKPNDVQEMLAPIHLFATEPLENADQDAGAMVKKYLKSAKWYLWHGNVKKALSKVDDCCVI